MSPELPSLSDSDLSSPGSSDNEWGDVEAMVGGGKRDDHDDREVDVEEEGGDGSDGKVDVEEEEGAGDGEDAKGNGEGKHGAHAETTDHLLMCSTL